MVTRVPIKVKIPGSLSIPRITPYAWPTKGVKRKAVHNTSGEKYLSTIAVAPYEQVPVTKPSANTT